MNKKSILSEATHGLSRATHGLSRATHGLSEATHGLSRASNASKATYGLSEATHGLSRASNATYGLSRASKATYGLRLEPEHIEGESPLFQDILQLASPEKIRIDEFISKGSSCNVHLGYYQNRVVCVKMLNVKSNDTQTLKRILNEIKIMRELDHPYIAKLIDITVLEDCSVNLITDYCSSGSLRSLLNLKGRPPLNEIKKYLLQIIEGLDYIHRHNIVHLDLKCDNILITDNDNALIADFGVSKVIEPKTTQQDSGSVDLFKSLSSSSSPSSSSSSSSPFTSDYIRTTFRWAPPEVLLSNCFSTKSDIWSLGCLAIELLTANSPFPYKENQLSYCFFLKELTNASSMDLSFYKFDKTTEEFLNPLLSICPEERPSCKELLTNPIKYSWLYVA